MAETMTLKVNNGKAQVVKFGRGKRTFIILPGLSYDGFFDTAKIIEQAYSLFNKDFTVYLIDRNLTPFDRYTVKDMADDVADACKKLGVFSACVFGASLGGMVAQSLAINYPALVDKLVIGSSLSRPNDNFTNVLTDWEEMAKAGEIDKLLSFANKKMYCPYTLKKYAEVFRSVKTLVTDEKTERFIAYVKAAKGIDVYNSLDKIKAKTLVIGALKDKITTVQGARETAEKLNAQYIEYKKYGHAVFDEAKGYKKHMYDFFVKRG